MFESFYHEPLKELNVMTVHEGQGYIPVYDTNNKVVGFESDSRNQISIPFNINSTYCVERNSSCWPDVEGEITEEDFYDPNDYESIDGWKGYKGEVGDRYYDRQYDITKGQTKHLSWTLVAKLKGAKINIWNADENLTIPNDGKIRIKEFKEMEMRKNNTVEEYRTAKQKSRTKSLIHKSLIQIFPAMN